MSIFKGAGVAIVTPMNEDESVNYGKLEELIEEQIAGGTDAIIICGTTGESACLTVEEHLETIRFCVEKTAHRVPVTMIDQTIDCRSDTKSLFQLDVMLCVIFDLLHHDIFLRLTQTLTFTEVKADVCPIDSEWTE